jgi:hypothetical protein
MSIVGYEADRAGQQPEEGGECVPHPAPTAVLRFCGLAGFRSGHGTPASKLICSAGYCSKSLPYTGQQNILHSEYNCRSVADPDPGSGAFLTPGSGMGKKSGSGSGINNPDHISESLEFFFC